MTNKNQKIDCLKNWTEERKESIVLKRVKKRGLYIIQKQQND